MDDTVALAEDRGAMTRPVLKAAEKGILEIVVSTLCLAEVLPKVPTWTTRPSGTISTTTTS